MDPIAEIKSRISIEELVSRYVPLKKAGRSFKALCPFHNERTPSFYVSPEKQLAYCFGCHKGGDQFKFIEEIEGVDFRGALEMLAERAGVELPKRMPEPKEKKSERDRLIAIHEISTLYFEEQLWEDADGKKVLSYLKKRGLNENTIKESRLGFVPDSKNSLYIYLLKKDFTRAEIISAGLAIARDTEEDVCIDRFRMRLMFPIHNLAGGICAFGGRAVRDGDEPKYLNSPETPVFHKSSMLYLLAQARQEIRTTKTAVIVEGYMDALAAHQAGFGNVVACGGTALTQEQIAILKRFAKTLIFAFDNDNAGKLATQRSLEMAFADDFSLRVAVWQSDAKDPDECIRENPDVFKVSLDNAMLATDYLLDIYQKQFDIAAISGKKAIVESLLPYWSQIKSPVELDAWLRQCAALLALSETSLYDALKRFQKKQNTLTLHREIPQDTNPKTSIQIEEYLLGLLLTYSEITSIANNVIRVEDFKDAELQNIYRSLGTQYNQLRLPEAEKKRADFISMYVEMKCAHMSSHEIREELISTMRAFLKQRFDEEKRVVISKLQSVNNTEKENLLELYQQLLSREKELVSSLSGKK